MAHAVKCVYCGEIFDRDRELCVEVSPRRYAHAACDKQGTEDLKELEEYIKKIFCETTVNAKIKKQILMILYSAHFKHLQEETQDGKNHMKI